VKPGVMPARGVGVLGLETLTRRHAFKLCPTVECSVEDCALAVGGVIGYESIKSASRMNNGVVIFVDSFDKVVTIVEQGVTVNDSLVQAVPLVNPAKKIILSQVPPFISNEMLERELSRHGQLMSPIKTIGLGCKSPHLRHVVSFRRQVFMILKNNNEELNLVFKFRVDDYDYNVYVTSEKMKCFGCGMEGHLIRSCPEKSPAEINNKSIEQGESSTFQKQKQNELNEFQGQKLSKTNKLQGQKQNGGNESQCKLNENQGQKLSEANEIQEQKQSQSDETQGKKLTELKRSQGQKRIESEGIKLNKSHKVQKLEQNKGPTQKKDELFQVPSPVESSQQYVVEEVASNGTQKEVVFPLAEEGEMQVDDKSEDNVKKRKARDGFQISNLWKNGEIASSWLFSGFL